MVTEDNTVIATQVNLKMSTVKPLHAIWVINTHNLIPQRPELIRSGFRKVGLLSDTVADPGISKRGGPWSRRGRILGLGFVLMPLHTYPMCLKQEW